MRKSESKYLRYPGQNMGKRNYFNIGQSLLEVVFTLAVVALIVTGVVAATTVSVRNASFSRNNSLANSSVSEASEWLRGQRDAGWAAFIAHFTSVSTYCFVDINTGWSKSGACGVSDYVTGTNNLLKRQATFTCYQTQLSGGTITSSVVACNSSSANDVRANIVVSWNDSGGLHNITTTNDFSNWQK